MDIRRLLSKISFGLMVTLAPITLAILTTWNTLPGQALYPLKRGLETIALLVLSPSFQARSSLQAGLVDRRTEEATSLIASSGSSQGLDELKAQIESAKLDVINAKNPEAKRTAAIHLKTKLQEAQQNLQQAKTTIAYSQPGSTYIPPGQPQPTHIPPGQPTPTPTIPVIGGGDDDIIDDIDDTIDGIGDDMVLVMTSKT